MSDQTFERPYTLADVPAAPRPAAKPPSHPFPVAPPPMVENIGDPATSRLYSVADHLLATKPELRDRVLAAMTVEGLEYVPDERSLAQQSWDNENDIPRIVDARAYSYQFPTDTPVQQVDLLAFDHDLRDIASDLAFPQAPGSSFIRMLCVAAAAQGREPDLAIAAEKHDRTIRAVVGDKYEAQAKAITAMLDTELTGIANRKMVAALKPDGILGQRPEVFVALAHKAARLAYWRNGRPT
jgi:hypothetical protein